GRLGAVMTMAVGVCSPGPQRLAIAVEDAAPGDNFRDTVEVQVRCLPCGEGPGASQVADSVERDAARVPADRSVRVQGGRAVQDLGLAIPVQVHWDGERIPVAG